MGINQIMKLFRLLHVLCRRPIMSRRAQSPTFRSTCIRHYWSMFRGCRRGPEIFGEPQTFAEHLSLGPGHDAQHRVRQDNFLRDRSRADRLGAGSATHRAAAHVSGFSRLCPSWRKPARRRISVAAPYVPAANPVIPVRTSPMVLLPQLFQDFRGRNLPACIAEEPEIWKA